MSQFDAMMKQVAGPVMNQHLGEAVMYLLPVDGQVNQREIEAVAVLRSGGNVQTSDTRGRTSEATITVLDDAVTGVARAELRDFTSHRFRVNCVEYQVTGWSDDAGLITIHGKQTTPMMRRNTDRTWRQGVGQ